MHLPNFLHYGIWDSDNSQVKFQHRGGLRQGILNALCHNAHQSGAVLNIGNQLIPRPDRKVFDVCLIHIAYSPSSDERDKLFGKLIYCEVRSFQCQHISQNRAILFDLVLGDIVPDR